ncbi:MAG: hypothetical protein GQ542_20480 [Desulforhopalus sp.]|nr:hypothetical protein [Desulforhopalus sp.]
MESFLVSDSLVDEQYHGSILLSVDYSAFLRGRLAEYIKSYRAFENSGSPAMLYIAAWEGNCKRIWYEYASNDFIPRLLNNTRSLLRKMIRAAWLP